MAVYVTFANLNTEEKPSFYVKVEKEGRSRPDTWYRKKIEYPSGLSNSILPQLATMEGTRRELEAVAEAAFKLGREVEQAIQEGARIGRD